MARLASVTLTLLTLAWGAHAGERALLLEQGDEIPSGWAVETRPCEDGQARALFSTLPRGEMATGILRSPAFEAPDAMVFYVAGHSNQKKNEVRLVDADSGEVLRRTPPSGSDAALRREWDLGEFKGRKVCIELVDGDTGTGWAWLCVGGFSPDVVPEPQRGHVPAAWEARVHQDAPIEVDGVPFARRTAWPAGPEGSMHTLKGPGVRASHLYLLGGTYSPDSAGPAWGGANDATTHFLGDQAGRVEIEYASGQVDAVPMVFGYTLWWQGPYGFARAPFDSDPDARALTDAALALAHGLDADAPTYLRVALRPDPVVEVRLVDSEAKAGHPVIEGVTFAGVAEADAPAGFGAGEVSLTPAADAWLSAHTIASEAAWTEARQAAVHALHRQFATLAEDITHEGVAATPLGFDPATLPGPQVAFSGPPEATMLARTYYDSVNELLKRVDPDGMIHESDVEAPNFGGFGGWAAGLGPFYTSAYTRNRSAHLLCMLGDQTRADLVNDFFDGWIMYFPQAFPDVQMDGKPVPGHATVVANKPHLYFDELSKGGWPTRYTTRDMGNPETDGHGFNMLGHWRGWNKAGRDPEWVRARWEAIKEAAEYVPWCLENPALSFSEHGLLYSESEGGMTNLSQYANVLVYYGLLGYAVMAEAIGENAMAARWRDTAAKLESAMNQFHGKEDDDWGAVWDTVQNANWGCEQGVLAPILFAADRYGWDIQGELPVGWMTRTVRSYEMIRRHLKPDGSAPIGMGYGQNYFAQTALLLDRMAEAELLVHWLARFCFAPRLPHPYRVPEGAAVREDGSAWRRWGDLGNLYQMNETQYTVHLMMGVDDVNSDELRIMPRIPASWTGMRVTGYPVTTLSDGARQRVHVDVSLRRKGTSLTVALNADKPVDHWRLRMGPFPKDIGEVRVTRAGTTRTLPATVHGDSAWAWIEGGGETAAQTLEARW